VANPQTEDGFTQIANELLEHLYKMHLSPNQWQVLLCILRKTYGFHKKVDYIANSQIATATGLCKAVVSRCLHNLNDMNIIIREGRRIGFQKDWEKWEKLAELQTPEPKEPPKMKIIRGDGYIGIWKGAVEPELQCMATRQGYILEHRLVVARKLGRPLEPWERVHHKDGVRSHNSDDNLQLLQTPSATKLAEPQTKVHGKLAIWASTVAKQSTKVSSPAVAQKIKETIQKKEQQQATTEEIKLFTILEDLKGFPKDRPVSKLRELQVDYPNLNYKLEFKKFVEWWSKRKLKEPWLALMNWLEKARKDPKPTKTGWNKNIEDELED